MGKYTGKEYFVELMDGIILDDSIQLIKNIKGVFAFATDDDDRYAVGNISIFVIDGTLYACISTFLNTVDSVTFVISDSQGTYELNHGSGKRTQAPKCSREIIADLSNRKTLHYWLERREAFFVELPDEFDVEHFSIERIKYNSKIYNRTDITEDIDKLEELLISFSDRFFLSIDMNYELCKAWASNIIEVSINRFDLMCQGFIPVDVDENLVFVFRVPASYDKRYYCAAMISRIADKIECDAFSEYYYITINGSHVEELYLMNYYFGCCDLDTREALLKYLRDRYLPSYIEHNLSVIQATNEKPIHWFGMLPFSTLLYSLGEERRFKWDCYYRLAKTENRVPTKWAHEYRLYMMIKHLFPDAIHQYRTQWLGIQSIDIYIPSLNTAVEYQGEQHYKPVNFGVDDKKENERLEDNIHRDEVKRKLCEENYVRLLEWNYESHIDHNSVVSFLRENGIECSSVNHGLHIVEYEMAPECYAYVPENSKRRVETRSEAITHIIRKYSSKGNYIATYRTEEDAAKANRLSSDTIKRACRQEQGLAGGCQWRRVLKDSPIKDIDPVIEKRADTKQVHILAVAQLDPNTGEIVAQYDTQKRAALSVGISVKEILIALRNPQRSAGGYYWKYITDIAENEK